MINQTVNKNLMAQHLVVKTGLDQQTADTCLDVILELIEQSLRTNGKVVLKNIGTLKMVVLAGKVSHSFGVKKKLPTRYKIKFQQSRNFEITKLPLKTLGSRKGTTEVVKDELIDIVKSGALFSSDED